MPYYNKDPKRDHNFDNHTYAILLLGPCEPVIPLEPERLDGAVGIFHGTQDLTVPVFRDLTFRA